MKLQTEIPLKPEANQIDYSSKTLLLGSCFSENIGAKFSYFKFQNLQNPFGVIFNPVSIEKLIKRAINNSLFSEEDIFLHNGVWKCFEVHSELSCVTKAQFIENLNTALHSLREALYTSTHIVFTYGTSWVYRSIENNEVVANCHKLPQINFEKKLLSIAAISKSIENTIEAISTINTKANLLFTVSPVRHLKDGFTENSLSKAHLLSAIHQAIGQFSSEEFQLNYFPSFEIMMDELRDYRFYTEDMLHPSGTAIEIIWQKFSKVWIAVETESLQKEIATIQSGLRHKPFNPESEENLKFLTNLRTKISLVQQQFPHITF